MADYEQLGFPELIDISTLAKLLGVGERYVRRMIAERRVPTVKVGRLVRFDLAEIRRWLEEQRRPGGGSLRAGGLRRAAQLAVGAWAGIGTAGARLKAE